MSTINRATLPEEFYDKTTDLLLKQPEPQYLFAHLYMNALQAELSTPDAIGLAIEDRQVTGVNADYIAYDRDRLNLAAALPGELMAAELDFYKAPGNTIRLNRPKYTNTVYTEASRRISSGSTISTTPTSLGSEQTSLTLFRYAGPFDVGANAVAPYAVESFDALMGVHKLSKIVGVHLQRDYHRFIDVNFSGFGDAGGVVPIYPDEAVVADSGIPTAGAYPATVEQLSRGQQLMDDLNLPTLGDGHRVAVLRPAQWKQIKHDPEYTALSSFHKEFNLLFKSYVGTVSGFHVFVSTTLPAPVNGSGVAVAHGQLLAPGAFMCGMGSRPLVRSASDDNYGLTPKVIWEATMAFALADNRFILSFRSA